MYRIFSINHVQPKDLPMRGGAGQLVSAHSRCSPSKRGSDLPGGFSSCDVLVMVDLGLNID